MRRDTFLKSLGALALAGGLPLAARASANLKMMIPANPGGGWDTTGRALGKALQDAGLAASVQFENKGGAAGAIGLAQFVNASKGDPNALMVMGAVMLGALHEVAVGATMAFGVFAAFAASWAAATAASTLALTAPIAPQMALAASSACLAWVISTSMQTKIGSELLLGRAKTVARTVRGEPLRWHVVYSAGPMQSPEIEMSLSRARKAAASVRVWISLSRVLP